MIPVARSYLQQDWESTAGMYAARQVVKSCKSNNSTRCTVVLPSLPAATDPKSLYLLTSYAYSTDVPSQVARFLEQTTFGPTLQGIKNFMDNGAGTTDLQTQMALWVKNQMNPNVTTPTYHREFFRKRVGGAMTDGSASRTEMPRHPCDKNSRWRRHSFTRADRNEQVVITRPYNDDRLLMSVHGIPRTIVKNVVMDKWNQVYQNLTEGTYKLCWWIEEYLGGYLEMELNDGTFNCYSAIGGNPAVVLTDDILTKYLVVLPTLTLPPIQNFRELNLVLIGFYGPDYYGGGGLMYDQNISDPRCKLLPTGAFGNLVGNFSGGEKSFYDAQIRLDMNTVSNPIPDGGGTSAMAGTLCSNVPKTFLNIESCYLTNLSTACSPFKANPKFTLSTNTSRLFYQVLGRFVYAVRGFSMQYVSSPCTPYVRNRWKKIINSTCVTPGIDSVTNETLTSLLKTYGSWDQNDLLVDIHLEWNGEYDGSSCDSSNTKTIGMQLLVDGVCYQQIHPDEYSVYDMTYWTLPDTHPGNKIAASLNHSNPIKKWAESDQFELIFPSWHPMDRWENNKKLFDYVGRFGNSLEYFDLPSKLRTKAIADTLYNTSGSVDTVVVCGSPGEVSNDPTFNQVFNFVDQGYKASEALDNQKKNVWNTIALSAPDQLLQRMSWALSQILVITPNQINDQSCTEMYLNYHDIFNRNAFGNYRNVLKEVSYSPMMAEMLSFLDSKSTAYVLRTNGVKANPDENYAREVMQLFSIGISHLNMNGTLKLDPVDGSPIPTYKNKHIQSFARGWTGFQRQESRSNVENGYDWEPNRIDPMRINPWYRDVYPKINLYDGFIGDAFPLCSDLPKKQFLKPGAKYVLLGSASIPEFQSGDPDWWVNEKENILRMSLNSSASELYKELCNSNSPGGECKFKPVVVLNKTLNCIGLECKLDNLRAFQVSQKPLVYYEYVRPACVELSFYNSGKKISKTWPAVSMCANSLVDEVMDACCPPDNAYWGGAQYLCQFTGERVKYATGVSRCKDVYGTNADACDWEWLWNNGENNNQACNLWLEDNWHWTNMPCSIRAKVDENGDVSIAHDYVHTVNQQDYVTSADFNENNTNYFPVYWEGGSYPSVANKCGSNICATLGNECLCNVAVVENRVFNKAPNSTAEVINRLFIGSFEPTLSNYTLAAISGEVKVYHKIGGTQFDSATVFGVTIKGRTTYYKNIRSMVVIKDSSGRGFFRFRNPPHFMSFIIPDTRDAMYETEAILDNYFFHNNTAPFLATRFIQRFGISNPSPKYVNAVATAFTEGYFLYQNITFGDRKYGSLGALAAAVLFDPEARSVVLDADPSSGSLREPMIKLIAFMRAMNFTSRPDVAEITFNHLQNDIGQMPHSIPNVFSYFSPDYSSGKIQAASLVAPESQVLNSPAIVGYINGIISLIELGLTDCYGGFGERTAWWCPWYNEGWFDKEKYSRGFLRYSPLATNASALTDELALVLTSGRLSSASRKMITNKIQLASSMVNGLNTAQKLIVTTPEFHSTRTVASTKVRPKMVIPPPSGKGYKAVVFAMLSGGMDSYNVLVPHSGCPARDLYAQYANIRGELALSQSELLQIDASSSSQPCNTFGLHPNLVALQQLYNDKDLVLLANTGVLQTFVTKADWYQKTYKTSLFSHNDQQGEVNFVDIFDKQSGRGVCGRMTDVLTKNGYKAGSLSVAGVANALVSKLNALLVLDPEGVQAVNPIPWAEDIVSVMKVLNNANKLGSSLYGDQWSDRLHQALGENSMLYDALTATNLDTIFPDNYLAVQLESVAKLIKTRSVRGTDRDTFYVELSGFDTHSDMKATLANRMDDINGAVDSFVKEMKFQGRWDEVVVIFVSEFARTLTPNTSKGSDHAWGGNYWFFGGSVSGGKIIGQYPPDLSNDSPYRFDPGVVIPTTSWDDVWVLIAQWFGISGNGNLTEVVPNRQSFSTLSGSLSTSNVFTSI